MFFHILIAYTCTSTLKAFLGKEVPNLLFFLLKKFILYENRLEDGPSRNEQIAYLISPKAIKINKGEEVAPNNGKEVRVQVRSGQTC